VAEEATVSGADVRQAQEATERTREETRRRTAYILVGTLVIVVLASFVYVIWVSLTSGNLTVDSLISVLQTIGTTLLAPLVGLIGAVVGFYYGGQTAVQGAQTATQAASQATQATRTVTQAATDLASQIAGEQPSQRTTQQQPPQQ
jgi:hypothetical protein